MGVEAWVAGGRLPVSVNGVQFTVGVEMADTVSQEETFTASRLTKGNLFFPTRIVVGPLRVSRVKRRLFGNTEESISITQVASVKISTGIFWSDILIESTGGTDPIASHGHRKADAVRIRDLVETFQVARR